VLLLSEAPSTNSNEGEVLAVPLPPDDEASDSMQIDDGSAPLLIVPESPTKSGCNVLEGTPRQERITKQKEISPGPSPRRIAALQAKHKSLMLGSQKLFRRLGNELSFLRKKKKVVEGKKECYFSSRE